MEVKAQKNENRIFKFVALLNLNSKERVELGNIGKVNMNLLLRNKT